MEPDQKMSTMGLAVVRQIRTKIQVLIRLLKSICATDHLSKTKMLHSEIHWSAERHWPDQGLKERVFCISNPDVPVSLWLWSCLLHILSECPLSCQLPPSCSPTAGRLPPSCPVLAHKQTSIPADSAGCTDQVLPVNLCPHPANTICTRSVTKQCLSTCLRMSLGCLCHFQLKSPLTSWQLLWRERHPTSVNLLPFIIRSTGDTGVYPSTHTLNMSTVQGLFRTHTHHLITPEGNTTSQCGVWTVGGNWIHMELKSNTQLSSRCDCRSTLFWTEIDHSEASATCTADTGVWFEREAPRSKFIPTGVLSKVTTG